MKKSACAGLILMTVLLTGCGSHLSHHLTAGRQMPITATRGAISIPLNGTSEVQLNLRGFRLGLSPQTESDDSIARQPEPTPWLRYRLHF
jgi:outer membrane lipopolysaccharide assembly protein LptE/RlpB